MRRVSSIALVHDTLSMSVDEEVNLDQVVDRMLPMMNDVATVDTPIRIVRVGDLGVLDADRATALVMVVTELVQNAIEHAFDGSTPQGCVTIRCGAFGAVAGRGRPRRRSWPARGLQPRESPTVWDCRSCGPWWRAELDGSLGMHAAPTGGTDVVCGCRSAGVAPDAIATEANRRKAAALHRVTAPIFVGAVELRTGAG